MGPSRAGSWPSGCEICDVAGRVEDLYRKNGCEIFRCRSCGTGWARPLVGFKPIEYYTEDYFTGRHVDGYSDYQKNVAVRKAEFRATLRDLVRVVPNGGRLLEIGCAYGYFLEVAQDYFECSGVELAEEAVAACRARGLQNVYHGTCEDAIPSEASGFDVAVLLDVIEHLERPVEVLEHVSRLLRPNGVVLMTTGDFGSLAARVMGRRWRLMTPPQHLWFFTVQSMHRLAESCGFEVLRIDHPSKFVPLSMVARKALGVMGLNVHAEGTLSTLGVSLNLRDAMRVYLKKAHETPMHRVLPS